MFYLIIRLVGTILDANQTVGMNSSQSVSGTNASSSATSFQVPTSVESVTDPLEWSMNFASSSSSTNNDQGSSSAEVVSQGAVPSILPNLDQGKTIIALPKTKKGKLISNHIYCNSCITDDSLGFIIIA